MQDIPLPTGRRAGTLRRAIFLAILASGTARAQAARPPQPAPRADNLSPSPSLLPDPTLWSGSVESYANNRQLGVALAGRLRLPSRVQLGASLGGSTFSRYYVAGLQRDGGRALEAQAWTVLPLAEIDSAQFTFNCKLGGRQLWLTGNTSEPQRATRTFSELGMMAHVRTGSGSVLRLGPVVLLDFEVAPSFAPASVGQLVHLGHALSLGESFALSTRLEAGGTYGFDGNNEKFLVRGGIELLARLGEGSRSWLVF